jgi:PadR family transcriptional regulator, regulatory protein AphA
MSLPHALLGLLNYRPATGYDLKATFNSSINLFWNASLPQIYRTLSQMERSGWLTFTTKHQAGKPSRKIYQLTSKGKKELQQWLSAPPDFPPTKNTMLVKLFFGNQMDKKDLVLNIRKWRERYANILEKMNKDVKPAAQYYEDKATAKDDVQFWMLAADYGIRYARMVVEWCDAALGVVESGKKIKI